MINRSPRPCGHVGLECGSAGLETKCWEGAAGAGQGTLSGALCWEPLRWPVSLENRVEDSTACRCPEPR